MKKMVLTRKWKNRIHSNSTDAQWGIIRLHCQPVLSCGTPATKRYRSGIWIGSANIGLHHKRIGPLRRSEHKAKQDAQRLTVELYVIFAMAPKR